MQYLPISLFLKLGKIQLNDGRHWDGEDTIRCFMEKCDESKHVWFGLDFLKNGISDKKKELLNDLIEANALKIYFAVNNQHYENEIGFTANVVKLIAEKELQQCPDIQYVPTEFAESSSSKVWLMLENIKESDKHAEEFIIASTGSNLKYVITHSRFFFGYIME